MSATHTAPYGAWVSPITSDRIAAGTIGLMEPAFDGDAVTWIEMRPSEGGRYALVRRSPDGHTADVTPPDFNARTRVHEYGGGSYLVVDGSVFASNFDDQRLYRIRPGEPPVPITPAGDVRYADAVADRDRARLVCVREDHTTSDRDAVNSLCAVDASGETEPTVLAAGRDFFAAPRLSPDAARLAWLAWDHPDMPWDATELFVADVRPDGSLGEPAKVAGGPGESVLAPAWSPDGTLYFVSDRTDWWNLYRLRGEVEAVCTMEAEFAAPPWVFRRSLFAFTGPARIVCAYTSEGLWRLATVDTATGELRPLDVPYTSIGAVRARGSRVVFCGGSPTKEGAVFELDLETGRTEVLRRASTIDVDPDYLSAPEPIEFPTTGGRAAHALFYRPQNKDFTAPEAERPPLLVKIHGGPTSACSGALNLSLQYWTSRGWAVVDVNYGGSTGYGRPYRERLRGQWGVVDVDDCCAAARYLAERGEADADRLAIRGGSAGGYTTLAALALRDVFHAGASYFGVSDAEALAKETHKFESRYLDGLIAPYPEGRDLYRERSALYHLDGLDRPLILFQGLEDRIVPPNQSETLFEALKQKGVPVAYVPFEGEQHGFRRSESIKRALDAEAFFYSKVFGFTLADKVEPVDIENLST
jgi:dipeptidyl aminopeptidase/acylaminoacyl peptidase